MKLHLMAFWFASFFVYLEWLKVTNTYLDTVLVFFLNFEKSRLKKSIVCFTSVSQLSLTQALFPQVENIIMLTDSYIHNDLEWAIKNYRKETGNKCLYIQLTMSDMWGITSVIIFANDTENLYYIPRLNLTAFGVLSVGCPTTNPLTGTRSFCRASANKFWGKTSSERVTARRF